jgi:alanine racemase
MPIRPPLSRHRRTLPRPAPRAGQQRRLLSGRSHFDLVRAASRFMAARPHGRQPDAARGGAGNRDRPVAQRAGGAGVGYGLTFHAARETRIATIPVGYADGWRALSNRGAAWIAGHRAPIIGRVSMDSITLDVTDVPPICSTPARGSN